MEFKQKSDYMGDNAVSTPLFFVFFRCMAEIYDLMGKKIAVGLMYNKAYSLNL